jgi:hypothetical protein
LSGAITERTPAGYLVEFEPEPRRLYRIDGEEVLSVTTVLGILDKPGLPWWGMTLGAEAVVELLRRCWRAGNQGAEARLLADPVGALKAAKMTVNHKRDKAGDRGSTIHDALERLVGDGIVPDPTTYPEDQQGYVAALLAWYEDACPQIEDAEVLVGSKRHGYAGRYDLRAWQPSADLVVRSDTGARETFEAGTYRIDAKTPKGVYGSHLLQLDGYEIAAVESGYKATDGQYVLRLGADGLYEAVPVRDYQRGHFPAIVAAQRAVEACEPTAGRAAKKPHANRRRS